MVRKRHLRSKRFINKLITLYGTDSFNVGDFIDWAITNKFNMRQIDKGSITRLINQDARFDYLERNVYRYRGE